MNASAASASDILDKNFMVVTPLLMLSPLISQPLLVTAEAMKQVPPALSRWAYGTRKFLIKRADRDLSNLRQLLDSNLIQTAYQSTGFDS